MFKHVFILCDFKPTLSKFVNHKFGPLFKL
jgi:hypothetical protein